MAQMREALRALKKRCGLQGDCKRACKDSVGIALTKPDAA